MVVYTSCEPSGFTSRFSTTSVVGNIAKFSQGSDFLNTVFIEVISEDDVIENDVIKPGDTVEIDGKVYVLYTLVKPYGHAIEAGVFTDPNRVSQTINSVREFTDPSAKLIAAFRRPGSRAWQQVEGNSLITFTPGNLSG